MSTQQSLFIQSCTEMGHDYEPADQGYYKENSEGIRDKQKVFRMIYCTRCGDNMEIMVVDRTQPKVEIKKRIVRRKK